MKIFYLVLLFIVYKFLIDRINNTKKIFAPKEKLKLGVVNKGIQYYILEKFVNIEINHFKDYSGMLKKKNDLDILLIRECELSSKKYDLNFLAGLNYEYLLFLSIKKYENISELYKDKITIGTTINNINFLLIFLKTILLTENINFLVKEKNDLCNLFNQQKIDVIFDITDENDIYFKNLYLKSNFNILNLDIKYPIKTIYPLYEKTLPLSIYQKDKNNYFSTYAVRNIFVTNKNKDFYNFLETLYINSDNMNKLYNDINSDNNFQTEFLKKNHIFYMLPFLNYNRHSYKYSKKNKFISILNY